MDSSHVGLWVCGWTDKYVGCSHAVEDDLGYWQGDGFEPGEGEVVNCLLGSCEFKKSYEWECRVWGWKCMKK
jgi:hypothetical protein